MLKPKKKEWRIVNHVYYKETNKLYGYKIRNKDLKHRFISVDTAKKLIEKGIVEPTNMYELSYCFVPPDYKENTDGLL